MLKSLKIIKFYDKKEPIFIDLSKKLTILTGDNGVGKTTLLNLIFNILNGEFITLLKTSFEKIILELDIEHIQDRRLKSKLVWMITVDRKSEELKLTYTLANKKEFIINLNKITFPFSEYMYEFIKPKLVPIEKSDKFNDFFDFDSYYDNLSELVERFEELNFINSLKENIIYFPTYRRIDSDIIELLEQNYPVNSEKDLYEINRTINNFPKDRRVVGVSDNDIDYLYKSYAEKCRKLNSEGLNKVLKSFIEEMITSTYKKPNKKSKKLNPSIDLYDKAPEQLIELSKQLNIEGINESEIKDYFFNQKMILDFAQNTSVKLSFEAENTHAENPENEKVFKEELLLKNILLAGNNNKLVMSLINLYDQHIKVVNKELEPFKYLKESFEVFFGKKINLTLSNYKLELSRSFQSLSTGEKQLITILSYTTLSLNSKNYKPLIIIDEPELSLHISWQMKFLNKLLDLPDINVLLATHSPYIANSDYEDFIWQLGDIDEY